MSGIIAKAVTMSENRKLGKASTTYVSQVSCPSDCVFMHSGCYAERGWVGFHLSKLNTAAEEQGTTPMDAALAEAAAIDAMATVVGRPLRLHTVGDCASDEAAEVVSAAAERYEARAGAKVWTYSHSWRNVSRRSWRRVSVLASCETEDDVLEARKRGYATAIVVDKFESAKKYVLGKIAVLPCPNQTRHVACSDCRLCFDDERLHREGLSIAFEVHGDLSTRKRAREALEK